MCNIVYKMFHGRLPPSKLLLYLTRNLAATLNYILDTDYSDSTQYYNWSSCGLEYKTHTCQCYNWPRFGLISSMLPNFVNATTAWPGWGLVSVACDLDMSHMNRQVCILNKI